MRPPAQVDEVAFAIQADRLVGRDGGDDLGLVLFPDAIEEYNGVIALPFLARDGFVLLRQLRHFLFNGCQILRREGTLVREVVIKAVVDHRTDGDLGIREQAFHGIGQQMRGGVPDQVQSFGILGRDDAQAGIALDAETPYRPDGRVRRPPPPFRPGGTRQSRTYGLGNLRHRDRAREFTSGAVGQGDLYHLSLPENKNAASRPRFGVFAWCCDPDRRAKHETAFNAVTGDDSRSRFASAFVLPEQGIARAWYPGGYVAG